MPIPGVPFTDEQLFPVCNAVLPAWALLAIAPSWRGTRALVTTAALLFSALYAALVVNSMLQPEALGGYFSDMAKFEGVARLLSTPSVVLPAWVHYCAFDLWTGLWMAGDAVSRGVPQLLLVPCLAATMLFGPAGLLLYWLVRAPFNRPPADRKAKAA